MWMELSWAERRERMKVQIFKRNEKTFNSIHCCNLQWNERTRKRTSMGDFFPAFKRLITYDGTHHTQLEFYQWSNSSDEPRFSTFEMLFASFFILCVYRIENFLQKWIFAQKAGYVCFFFPQTKHFLSGITGAPLLIVIRLNLAESFAHHVCATVKPLERFSRFKNRIVRNADTQIHTQCDAFHNTRYPSINRIGIQWWCCLFSCFAFCTASKCFTNSQTKQRLLLFLSPAEFISHGHSKTIKTWLLIAAKQ